ncbi:MAG: hypothetical protein H0W50_02290 [Parachlamydiaceae bacterium]|nr:hypothetical protein [Parachlamydiaceae bacterium]
MQPYNKTDTISVNNTSLQLLASQVDASDAKVLKSLSTVKGRVVTWLLDKQGKMPKWAAQHIEIHKQLEKAVNEMHAKGEGGKIPENVAKTLTDSKAVIRKIANKVNYPSFLNAIRNQNTVQYSDQSKLLTPLKPRVFLLKRFDIQEPHRI